MILYLIACLTGILVKTVDTIEDEKIKVFKGIKYFFSINYGLLIGFVIANYPYIAPLWIGAILGVAITGKVDVSSHKLGVIIALITTIFLTSKDFNNFLNNFNILLLMLFSIASFTDEKIDMILHKIKNKNLIQKMFESRLTLEITALIVSLTTKNWEIFFAILSFDIGYQLTEFSYKKLNLRGL